MALGISAAGWAATAAIGSVAVGAYSANRAGRSADNATAAAERSTSEMVSLGREELDWAKQQYADQADERQGSYDISMRAANSQIAGMDLANAEAARQVRRRQSIYEPLEDKITADAQQYDTADRRAQAGAQARADVEQSFTAAEQGLKRSLLRSGGGTLGSGRSMAAMGDMAIAKAKANAGATQTATNNVEQQGYARKMDSVGIGRGVIGNQATQQGIATNAGSAANASGATGVNVIQSGTAPVMAGYNAATGTLGNAASMYQSAANQAQAGFGNAMGGLGAVAGNVLARYNGSTTAGGMSNADILRQINGG